MHSLIFIVSKDKKADSSWNEVDMCDSIHMADYCTEELITEESINSLKKQIPELTVKFGPPSFKISKHKLETLRKRYISYRKSRIASLLDVENFINWYSIAQAAYPETGTFICVDNDGPMHIDNWLLDYADTDRYYIIKVFDYHF